MQITYQIEGMHCAACVEKVGRALEKFATHVNVTLTPPQAHLSGTNLPSLDVLNAAVSQVGKYQLLALATSAMPAIVPNTTQKLSWLQTYYPLWLIIGLIAVVALKGADSLNAWMLHFMAGFFVVFSFFKLLDIRGFRDAYVSYDLLAKRWNTYGLIYPFLELALGLALLFQFQLNATLLFSIVLMGFSSLGVIKALADKRQIRCACLGTVLNLPMSTITLVEDLGMVVMSIAMLV